MSASTNESQDQYQQIRSNERDNARMKYGLTEQEIRVLQECKTESFWYRCVPFSIAAVGANHLLASKGILMPHPKFGLVTKNMVGVLFAYILGKISYQSTCREKILRLENSPLADGMRRGLKFTDVLKETRENMNNPSVTTFPDSTGDSKVKLRDDYGANTDIDMDKNVQLKGLGDGNQSLDVSADASRKLPSHQSELAKQDYTSYDNLRQMNRDSHEQRMSALNTAPPPRTSPSQPLQQTQPTPTQQSLGLRRNQYGDIIEE